MSDTAGVYDLCVVIMFIINVRGDARRCGAGIFQLNPEEERTGTGQNIKMLESKSEGQVFNVEMDC